jgi:Na+/H+ antiporter NhaA
MTRLAVFSIALAFIVGFAFLTISAFAQQGVTVAGVISAFFVLLLAIGIVGALRHPPR